MIEYLADSDCLISFLKGRDSEVSFLTPLIERRHLATSIIVYAEIYEGLLEARVAESYRQGLLDVLAGVPLMGLDLKTAKVFAATRALLRGKDNLFLTTTSGSPPTPCVTSLLSA